MTAAVPDEATKPTLVGGNPLHIVHIAKHCGYANGNVHVAVDLACEQAKAGYKVTFASAGGTFLEMLEHHGVRHITLEQYPRKPLGMVASAYALTRFCQREKPSILHAHMSAGAALGYAASSLTGVPLVTTVHNSFDRNSVLMRLGKRVVAVSEAERQNLLKRGWKPDRVTAVVNAPNKSPREEFMKNTRSFTLARPNITMICALHRRKGVFDVINTFAGLAKDFPEWTLNIAGEGPDSAELKAQAVTLGLGERVQFLGFVSDPRTIFSQLDIFVLASYADPGSLSIGEARAAGCAIVASAVGGTPEMLDHGGAGRLFTPGDTEQLGRTLRELMQDPQARADLQKAARDGSERFDVEHLVGRYERVYLNAMHAAN